MRGKTPKIPITIRIDADVIEMFKATGPGWQTRMNAVLRQHTPGLRAKEVKDQLAGILKPRELKALLARVLEKEVA